MQSLEHDPESLWAKHREHLWGLCYRMTGSVADAEDLVQETFARAIERPPADLERSMRPWLVRVATNLAIDSLRRRKRREYDGPWLPELVETHGRHSIFESEDRDDVEHRYSIEQSVTLAFMVALEALTPVQRAVLLLVDVFGHSAAEAGEFLDMTPAHVRVTLSRARKALETYDAKPVVPSPEYDAKVRGALQRFFAAVTAGDLDEARACLSPDVVAANDGGGRVHAARKWMLGPDAVAKLFIGISKMGPAATKVELRHFNGTPCLVVRTDADKPRYARVLTFSVDVNDDGAIAALWVQLNPDKLARMS